jgi:hypothetical protein
MLIAGAQEEPSYSSEESRAERQPPLERRTVLIALNRRDVIFREGRSVPHFVRS